MFVTLLIRSGWCSYNSLIVRIFYRFNFTV